MTCHSCPHSAAVQSGEFKSTPWEEIPCSSCKLSESAAFSIPFDEAHPPTNTLFPMFDPYRELEEPRRTGYPVTAIYLIMNKFCSLPPEVRDVVCWRRTGLSYKEIAERQGTTIQCAEMRHKRAMKIWPALEALFPYKTAKRKRRRAKR